MQNKRLINTIYDAKAITKTKRIKVPSVDFPQSSALYHKDMGALGFGSNFFMNLTSTMNVKEGGHYRFIITSDDGFVLKIDNKKVCEFMRNRAFEPSVCSVNLKEGSHIFNLSYFQGGGPLGLKAEYVNRGKHFLVGESSKFITFEAKK